MWKKLVNNRKTILKHLGFWVVYKGLGTYYLATVDPSYQMYFWDMFFYHTILIAVFYVVAYFILPRFGRKETWHYAVMAFIGLFFAYSASRWMLTYPLQPYLNPTDKKGVIDDWGDVKEVLVEYLWLWMEYFIYGIGWWFYVKGVIQEKEKNLALEEKNKAIEAKNLALEERNKAIEAKNMALEEKNKALEEKAEAQRLAHMAAEEAKLAEITFLRSHLSPHFLTNTLHYLYIKCFRGHKEAGLLAIETLTDILRYSIRGSTQKKSLEGDEVHLSEEILYLQKVIELYKMCNLGSSYINFEICGEFKDKRILPLILISFVENAFKHGDLSDQENPLFIRLTEDEQGFSFFIKNRNGKKDGTEGGYRKALSNGIGLNAVKRRLELTYPQKHSLNVLSDSDYYSCHLSLYQ